MLWGGVLKPIVGDLPQVLTRPVRKGHHLAAGTDCASLPVACITLLHRALWEFDFVTSYLHRELSPKP